MDLQTLQLGLTNIGKESVKTYEDYYSAKTDFENLDEQKKQILSSLGAKIEGSEAQRMREAHNTPEWKEYLQGLKTARTRMNQELAKVKALEMRLSIYQSLVKTYRLEEQATLYN